MGTTQYATRRSDKKYDLEVNDEDKVRFNFDVGMLNSLIHYTQCDSVSRTDLANLQKLLEYTDSSMYINELSLQMRLIVVIEILNAMINCNLSNADLIYNKISENPSAAAVSRDLYSLKRNDISVSECGYIRNFVNEHLQYIEIYQKKKKLLALLDKIDQTCSFNVSYHETINDIKEVMGQLLVSIQNEDAEQGLLRDFSFSNQDAANLLSKVITKAKRPAAILQTGVRQLNAILSPGFQSGRLYTILGGSGKFKSGTLLNIADQIRLFNPQVNAYENGLRKCILFITLENSIEESIERLFDMYSDMDADLRTTEVDQVISILQEQGGFAFNGQNPGIDIYFKYAGNLEISTQDIHTMLADLTTKGMKPICIILDYIKRINSSHPSNGDERVRMSYVAKELKSIAQFYEMPVITAMQLNREGNSIIDAAMRDSKQDVARFVGASSIGNAWDIVEDSDWVCLINLEIQKSSQKLFLTFKRLKIRGKKMPNVSDYFNHPFINAKNIRLQPDVNLDGPVSVVSLSNDLESINEDQDDGRISSHSFVTKNLADKSSRNVLMQLSRTTSTNMNSAALE